MEILTKAKLNLSKAQPQKGVLPTLQTRIIMVIQSTPMLLRSMPWTGLQDTDTNGIVTKLPIPYEHPSS